MFHENEMTMIKIVPRTLFWSIDASNRFITTTRLSIIEPPCVDIGYKGIRDVENWPAYLSLRLLSYKIHPSSISYSRSSTACILVVKDFLYHIA